MGAMLSSLGTWLALMWKFSSLMSSNFPLVHSCIHTMSLFLQGENNYSLDKEYETKTRNFLASLRAFQFNCKKIHIDAHKIHISTHLPQRDQHCTAWLHCSSHLESTTLYVRILFLSFQVECLMCMLMLFLELVIFC